MALTPIQYATSINMNQANLCHMHCPSYDLMIMVYSVLMLTNGPLPFALRCTSSYLSPVGM